MDDSKDVELYEHDLFIAYFKGEGDNDTSKAAEALYDELKRRRPDIDVYFQEKQKVKAYSETRTLDGVVERHSKAFLLLVNPKLERYPDPKRNHYVRLRKKMSEGKEEPRESLLEILAAKRNESMCKIHRGRMTRPMRLLNVGEWADGFDGFFDPNDVGTEEINEDLEKVNPFHGDQGFYADPEGKYIDEIIDWLDAIRAETLPVDLGLSNIYWVGTRQSDIESYPMKFFSGSICLFGDNDEKNGRYAYCTPDTRIDHNMPNKDADMWVYRTVKKVAEKDPNARFYCYNPSIVYFTFDEKHENPYKKDGLLQKFLCLNDEEILTKLNNKKSFHELCAKIPLKEGAKGVHLIPSLALKKAQISYSYLCKHLLEKEIDPEHLPRFVVQDPVSSGGVSTFVLDGSVDATETTIPLLQRDTTYICTEYQERNIPVNLHAIIFKEKVNGEYFILFSPISIQLCREEGRRIIYRGADYVEARNLNKDLVDEFTRQARLACLRLAEEGFYGICGIDGIVCDVNKASYTKEEAYDRTFILEVNARFQASSNLLNRALYDANEKAKSNHEAITYPSLQLLNFVACHAAYGSLWKETRKVVEPPKGSSTLDSLFSKIEVNYSNFCYANNGHTAQARHLLTLREDKQSLVQSKIATYELDGLPSSLSEEQLLSAGYEFDAHLFRLVFATNISHISEESRLYFHESVLDENPSAYHYIHDSRKAADKKKRMIYTKVALLIQGVRFGENVSSARPGTFQAVDLLFQSKEQFDNYVVNAPIVRPMNEDEFKNDKDPDRSCVPFTSLTPFHIENKNGKLCLYYYDAFLDEVLFFPEDAVASGKTKAGLPFGQLAYLSTDRLRVHLTNKCKFKRHGKGCRFCGICPGPEMSEKKDNVTFTEENVRETLEAYYKHYVRERSLLHDEIYKKCTPLRHFLIGGQTMDLDDEGAEARLIKTVRMIHEVSGGVMPIYAMIIPCAPHTVFAMAQNGLTELAFNIEIVDDALAERVMPGKRNLAEGRTFQRYLRYLEAAHRCLPRHEAVRSMLMIGLEPLENTLRGVKKLLDIDVQPMLSIFRPMPGTSMFQYMPPSIADVIYVYEEASRLCRQKPYNEKGKPATEKDKLYNQKMHMHLGPDCVPCQNNTVALPYEEEDQ